jgi:hypothetical protein
MMLMRIAGVGLLIASVSMLSYDISTFGGSAAFTSIEQLWMLGDPASLSALLWLAENGALNWFLPDLLDFPAGPSAAGAGLLLLYLVHRSERRPGTLVPVLP